MSKTDGHDHRSYGPPHWYVKAFWWTPERQRERSDLTNMAREYNADGLIDDDDFPCWGHRHQCAWMWW